MKVRFVIFSVSVPFFAVITCCTETLGNTESLQFVQSVNDNNTKEDGLENNMDKFNHLTTDSIVADVPSYMALATSEISARVGLGLFIIDSSICVAVMTFLPAL